MGTQTDNTQTDDTTQQQQTAATKSTEGSDSSTTAASGSDIDPKLVRSHPLFTTEMSKAHERIKTLEATLAELKQAEQSKAEQDRIAELEARKEYELILKEKDEKLKALEERMKRREREMEIDSSLVSAGMTDAELRELYVGKLAREEGLDVGSEIERLKTEKPILFGGGNGQQSRGARPAPPSGQPSSASTSVGNNWAELKAQLRDPKTAAAASAKLTEMVAQHGGLPENWSQL